ncbi:MAG: right-handed parallel beta-helix repeat-containing protein [Planctomycetes bacterium]|nr:right-handed parallel beta-helix repeat-containing protein [Planctomycetota bacterium]
MEQLEPRMLLAVVNWAGDVPDGTVWGKEDVHRLTADVRVPSGSTLTIEPGTLIQFNRSRKMQVEGTLNATGTEQDRILFTSDRDDTGFDGELGTADDLDTNGDGPSQGFRGAWSNIEFAPDSSGNMAHVELRFGGVGVGGHLVVDNATLSLTDSLIRDGDSGLLIRQSNPIVERVSVINHRHWAALMDLPSDPAISDVTISGNGINGMFVEGGTIASNSKWDDPDIVYWIGGDVTVDQSKTLTIEPGQVIKFDGGGAADELIVNGTLKALGTANQPIVFTSDRDDSTGGNTNNSTTPTTGRSGDWHGIQFTSTSIDNQMDHVEVRYGGFAGPQILVDQSELAITNSVIRDGITGLQIQQAQPVVRGVSFLNQRFWAARMDLTSDPDIQAVTVTGNGTNALVVDGGTINEDTKWDDGDITYLVAGDVTVAEGKKLMVMADQVVKFDGGRSADELIVNGTLEALGTGDEPVVFTSDLDDTAGGNTNNSATPTVGGFRRWHGIQFTSTSVGNVLDHVEVRYGGFEGPGQILVDNSELTLSNSVVLGGEAGLDIVQSAPTISNVTFEGNRFWAARQDLTSRPILERITTSGNGINGLFLPKGSLPDNTETVWDNGSITYYLDAGETRVPAGATLTIGPGQVIKGRNFNLIFDGKLNARGVPGQPIVITSYRDDSIGGNANNSNAPTTGNPGDWGRIELRGTGNSIEFAELRYGGQVGAIGTQVYVNGGQANIANTIVRDSGNFGVQLVNRAQATIENSLMHSNRLHGIIASDGSTFLAVNNTVADNAVGIGLDGAAATLRNNLVTHNGGRTFSAGIILANEGTLDASFNNVFNPGSRNYDGLEDRTGTRGNISVDPLYVDREKQDYQLHPDSPVIDAATSEAAPADDIDFNWRVDKADVPDTGAGEPTYYDIGAYEYGGLPRPTRHWPRGEVTRAHSTVEFTFREEMDTTSFDPATDVLSFTGPDGSIAVTGFRWLNSNRVVISYPEQGKAGDYSLVLGPAVLNTNGDTLDQDGDGVRGEAVDDRYSATWTITAPEVVSHSPNNFLGGTVDRITLQFDRDMDTASFVLADAVASFTGPDDEVIPLADSNWPDARTLEVLFATQSALGRYELILNPTLRDVSGNVLDQDRDGTSGEAIGDQYFADFTLADIFRVSGNIDTDTIWGGLVIMEDDATIIGGVTVTINAGTVVKFDELTSLTVESGGVLESNGTRANPVHITSIHDDSVGGDTNFDGNKAVPFAGDWLAVHIAGGTARFDHTKISFGGGSATGFWQQSGMLRTTGVASLEVKNSRLSEAFFDGVLTQGGLTTVTNTVIETADRGVVSWANDADVEVLNSTFHDNRVGMLAHGGDLNVVNTIISNSIAVAIDNDINPDPTVSYSNLYTPGGDNSRGFPDPVGSNGNVSIDPKYIDASNGVYRLDYLSPAIDAADGTAAPDVDATGAPRYDDPRVGNTGQATVNGTFADMGAFEFAETAPSNVDLVADYTSAPDLGATGSSISLEWRVRNLGSDVARGVWNDSVFLSTDAAWSIDDVSLGIFSQSGPLGANEAYTKSADITLPIVSGGSYYLIVRTNFDASLFEGINIRNNTSVASSSTLVRLELPEIQLGGSIDVAFTPGDTARYFVLNTPEVDELGSDLLISLNDEDDQGINELYIARGRLPTRSDFESNVIGPGADVEMQQHYGGEETFYVLAYAASLGNDSTANATLSASTTPFGISEFRPASAGNAGSVTLEVVGAGFSRDTVFRLVDASDNVVATGSVTETRNDRVYAEFSLVNVPVGDYEIEAENAFITQGESSYVTTIQSTRSIDSFVVANGGNSLIEVDLVVPEVVRQGRPFDVFLQYSNAGSIDVSAPLFVIDGSLGTKLQGPDDSVMVADSLMLIGTSSGGSAGALRPGQAETIRLTINPPRQSSADLEVSIVEPSDAVVDYHELVAALGFNGDSVDSVDVVAGLRRDLGNSWNELNDSLIRTAVQNSASKSGSPVHSVRELLVQAAADVLYDASPILPEPEHSTSPIVISSSHGEAEGNNAQTLDCSPEKILEYRQSLSQWAAAIQIAGGEEPAKLLLDYMNGVGGRRDFSGTRIARNVLDSNTGNRDSFFEINKAARFQAR